MTVDPMERNPFALARHISSGDFPCPACGAHARLSASVEDGGIEAHCECPSCGRLHLDSCADADGDILLSFEGRPCPSTFELLAAGSATEIRSPADAELVLRAGSSAICGIRPTHGARLLEKVCEVCAANRGAEGWEGAGDICARSAVALADVYRDNGRSGSAVELLKRYRDVASSTSMAADYAISAVRAQTVAGDPTEGLKDLRAVVKAMSESPLPHDPALPRAYDALGCVLEGKPDLQAAMKAYSAGIKECNRADPPTEASLSDLLALSSDYARAATAARQEKKAAEAVKNAVKACRERRDAFPRAYAEALIKKAKYIIDVDAVDPSMKGYLDEAISILESLPGSGSDPLIPIAWYYRSASSGRRDELDLADMGRAYEHLRDGLATGAYPDDMVFDVTGTYVQYLDFFDRDRSAEVRRELASFGFVFPPPPAVKDGAAPGSGLDGKSPESGDAPGPRPGF